MSASRWVPALLPAVFFSLGMSACIATDDHVPALSISSNTRWTISGSPYILPCKSAVVVARGATLSIDSGVTVVLPSRKECGTGPGLVIEGGLEVGAADAPAVFTNLTGDVPAGRTDFRTAIEFEPGSSGNLILNARFGGAAYETETGISVDTDSSPVEIQFGGTHARVATLARANNPDHPGPAASSLSRLGQNAAPVRPTASRPPLWFPADTFSGELDFGIAPAHNEVDLNRCHAGPGDCDAYASYRLRTNLAVHLFGRGPLSRVVALIDADTFLGNNHPGTPYSFSPSPIMLEHTVGLRINLPKGFWVEGINHSNHWFGRYAGSVGPEDLGPNGPYGQYSLISVGHKFQWSPRPWLAAAGY
jgi:hypothetical protein